MTQIFNRDILRLICKNINDSVTWCRFAQVNRYCNQLTKELLIHERRMLGYFNVKETSTRLPCGILHGLAEGTVHLRWHIIQNPWYTKYYKNGSVHGRYVVGNIVSVWKDGRVIQEPILSSGLIGLHMIPDNWWTDTGYKSVITRAITPFEFDQLTKF